MAWLKKLLHRADDDIEGGSSEPYPCGRANCTGPHEYPATDLLAGRMYWAKCPGPQAGDK